MRAIPVNACVLWTAESWAALLACAHCILTVVMWLLHPFPILQHPIESWSMCSLQRVQGIDTSMLKRASPAALFSPPGAYPRVVLCAAARRRTRCGIGSRRARRRRARRCLPSCARLSAPQLRAVRVRECVTPMPVRSAVAPLPATSCSSVRCGICGSQHGRAGPICSCHQ